MGIYIYAHGSQRVKVWQKYVVSKAHIVQLKYGKSTVMYGKSIVLYGNYFLASTVASLAHFYSSFGAGVKLYARSRGLLKEAPQSITSKVTNRPLHSGPSSWIRRPPELPQVLGTLLTSGNLHTSDYHVLLIFQVVGQGHTTILK